MEDEYKCLEKDKRLLVLFALGVLILIADLDIFANTIATYPEKHIWVEQQGVDTKLFRTKSPSSATDTSVTSKPVDASIVQTAKNDIEGRAFAFRKYEQEGNNGPAEVSPRIAFFLGLPFSINNADAEDLMLIKGIGPKLAENIISYREKHGPLTDINQLEKIRGIGPKMKQKLNDHCVFTYVNK